MIFREAAYVLWLGDSAKAGLGWPAIGGFVIAVVAAVAVAHFGQEETAVAESADREPAAA
ncbi:hypothetical protein [Kitasatospora sp. NPDC050463]|uniref:hypothetical protein n=1 Tax=Kitasatospora sp. NPDC050463 TaxID=3155786 RepID=UPI003403F66E